MTVTIAPSQLCGTILPPPSKSMSHRLILCAALAEGPSTLRGVALSKDVEATLSCLSALGIQWCRTGQDTIIIHGVGGRPWSGPLPHLHCGESGSTLRFLIPIVLAMAGGGTFTGAGRLMQRPLGPYLDLFRAHGITYTLANGTLTVAGTLIAGDYVLPGDVSSQFFTGLMLALPLLEGESTLTPSTVPQSWPYVQMTQAAQHLSGVAVRQTSNAHTGWPMLHLLHQRYRPIQATVERDWSQAAFWLAAHALGSPVQVKGMNPASTQGDQISHHWATVLAQPGDVSIDVSGCPDLVPPLAAMAAVRTGRTHLLNAARLRMKESDRLSTVRQTLHALGGDVEEGTDHLILRGQPQLQGGVTVSCCNDHRIAMMAAIAATRCAHPITLEGAECVEKSYPSFWADYQHLGGNVHVVIPG